MADILSLLSDRPIAYHRSLVKKYGLVAGVFLGQLLYWQGKGSKGQWVYKTQEEMKDETCLSRRNQETARKKLIEKGVLEEDLRGVPARLHFRVKLTELAKSLGISSLAEPSKLDCTKAPYSGGGTEQTITKNTQENTTERGAKRRPPQIDLLRDIVGRFPPRVIWQGLTNRLGPAPDERRLREVYTAWRARGHNQLNYDGILDWYEQGIPPPPNGHRSLPTQAEMNAGGRGKLVL